MPLESPNASSMTGGGAARFFEGLLLFTAANSANTTSSTFLDCSSVNSSCSSSSSSSFSSSLSACFSPDCFDFFAAFLLALLDKAGSFSAVSPLMDLVLKISSISEASVIFFLLKISSISSAPLDTFFPFLFTADFLTPALLAGISFLAAAFLLSSGVN